MNPELLKDFWQYVRLYVLITGARLCLMFLHGIFRFESPWQALWPEPKIMMQLFASFWANPLGAPFLVLGNGHYLLILLQFWLFVASIFWLLTTVLPAAVAAAPASRLPFISPASGPKPKVRQHSAWTVVITMTICLFVSFNIIGQLLGTALGGFNSELGRPFLLYPDLAAGFLSVLGVIYTLFRSKGASSVVGQRMGVTILPADDPLTKRVHAFAEKLNLPPPIVGTMDAMNAYAIGSKPGDAAVVIGKPLIENLTRQEVDAIIGHELGHVASNDMRRMLLAEGYQAIIGGLLGTIMRVFATALPRSRSQAMLAQSLYVLGRSVVSGGSELVVKRLSRAREYVADRTGAMLTSPEVMASALDKVCNSPAKYTSAENKYGYLMFRSAFQGNPFSTHPTLAQRKTSLLSFADEADDQAAGAGSAGTDTQTLSLTVKILAIGSMVAIFASALAGELAHNEWLQAKREREQAESARQTAASQSASVQADLAAKRRQLEAEKAAAAAAAQQRQEAAAREEQRARQAKQTDDFAIRDGLGARLGNRQPQYAPPPSQPVPSPFPEPNLVPAEPPVAQRIPQPEIVLCDQLAANPTDPQRAYGPGVAFPILKKNTVNAIAACQEAFLGSVTEPRFKYQLGRALYAANSRDPRAERYFSELVAQSYPAAFDNLGQIFKNRGDLEGAARVYRAGCTAGDPDSMISLADMIREGKVQATVPNEDDRLYDWAAALGHENAKRDMEQRRLQGQAVQTGIVVIKSLLGVR